jgi:2-amino-4-hydroxy-6-hydroxymethyldihydropteridine diphosphokinase
MKKQHIVYLSLGSNVEPREQTLQKAIELIRKHYEVGNELIISPIYESEPWGFQTEMKFLNLCIQAQTGKTPHEILKINQHIENELGRKPKNSVNYESRPIDIDILFFDNQIISTQELIVPHPHLEKRRFVLFPLNDLISNLLHPVLLKTIQELKEGCTDVSEPKLY